MTPAMEIRQARPRDDGAIEALHDLCFSDVWPEGMLSRRRECFLVAEEGGVLVGYVFMSTVLDEGSIDSIAVAPAHRRKGTADALVNAAVSGGRARALRFITLEVRAGNGPAVALYEKHGFSQVGRRKNYYEKPREDAVIMRLEL